jgi:hypothetical protein
MKYTAEAFSCETEFLEFTLSLPAGCDAQLAEIMGWLTPQRGDEGYNLDAAQIAALESLADTRFFDANYSFQLTCNAD